VEEEGYENQVMVGEAIFVYLNSAAVVRLLYLVLEVGAE
jgi:hypothetical protein